jgi:hypothetical protein
MIRKSVKRFSEKIMRQREKAALTAEENREFP